MRGYAWVCVGTRRYAWVCVGMRGYAWVCVGMRGYARVCVGMQNVLFFRSQIERNPLNQRHVCDESYMRCELKFKTIVMLR